MPIDRLQLQASGVLPLHYDLHVGMLLHKARELACTKPLPPLEARPGACKLVGTHIHHYAAHLRTHCCYCEDIHSYVPAIRYWQKF